MSWNCSEGLKKFRKNTKNQNFISVLLKDFLQKVLQFFIKVILSTFSRSTLFFFGLTLCVKSQINSSLFSDMLPFHCTSKSNLTWPVWWMYSIILSRKIFMNDLFFLLCESALPWNKINIIFIYGSYSFKLLF